MTPPCSTRVCYACLDALDHNNNGPFCFPCTIARKNVEIERLCARVEELEKVTLAPTPLVEALAAFMHATWANWYKHQRDTKNPVADTARWDRQSSVVYDELSDEDKEKDRVFARLIIGIIRDGKADGDQGTRVISDAVWKEAAETTKIKRKKYESPRIPNDKILHAPLRCSSRDGKAGGDHEEAGEQ